MDQHTVPRFYLEVFCDPVTPERHEPSLWVVGLREGTLKRRSPRRVATKPNYYSRTLPDGTADHGPETLLGVIESHTAPVLRKICDGSFSLTDDDRGALSFFVAFALVRVPAFRRYIEETGARVAESLLKVAASQPDYFERRFIRAHNLVMTPERAEAYRQAVSEATVTMPPEFSLRYTVACAELPASFIERMHWTFLVSKNAPFITSDTPVAKTNPRVRPPRWFPVWGSVIPR